MLIQQFIATHGYILLLAGTLLEGETVLIVAGFLAHRGYLELPWVIVVAFIGTLAGDQLYFFMGREKGLKYLTKRPTWQAKAERVFEFLRKHESWLILGFRFLYGFRTVTPFLIGVSGIPPRKFMSLNFIGAAAWAVLFSFLGYLLGSTLELFLKEMKQYELRIVLAITVIGAACWLVHLYRGRKNLLSKG